MISKGGGFYQTIVGCTELPTVKAEIEIPKIQIGGGRVGIDLNPPRPTPTPTPTPPTITPTPPTITPTSFSEEDLPEFPPTTWDDGFEG